MPDFTTIIPADLLPEAVREYERKIEDGSAIYVHSDAAIAAALELAARYKSELEAEHAKRCETCGQRETQQQDPFDGFYCGRHGWIVPSRDDPPMGCTGWEPRHD